MKPVTIGILIGLLALTGCSKNDPAEDAYQACEEPADCDSPEGRDPVCLEKSDEGFCSWECDADTDCEEASDDLFEYVCASFESELQLYCFPACAEEAEDAEDECPAGMNCRSTGGGSNNRKICFPDG